MTDAVVPPADDEGLEATAASPTLDLTPVIPSPPMPPVTTARHLLGASFDLLVRATPEMRRASFYIGAITLGLVGPMALAIWSFAVMHVDVGFDLDGFYGDERAIDGFAVLFILAAIGLVIVLIESRTLAASLLGGRLIHRPVTTRQAIARARPTFWRAIVAWLLLTIPVGIVEATVNNIAKALVLDSDATTFASQIVVATLIGAPLAYLLTGIVLGDVDPFEAARRSWIVFRARKAAALLVALFDAVSSLLILFGLSAGLDIVLRVFDALGLGPDSGPVGVAIVTAAIILLTFSFGTLLFTATAISLAPQVVMFVSLTHATIGLDHVRAGGDRDPDPERGRSTFRWFTLPMLFGIAITWLLLIGLIVSLDG
jgi:hypothetical protein